MRFERGKKIFLKRGNQVRLDSCSLCMDLKIQSFI